MSYKTSLGIKGSRFTFLSKQSKTLTLNVLKSDLWVTQWLRYSLDVWIFWGWLLGTYLLYLYFFQDHAIENENKYDGVVASEIIEHVNNKDIFVQSCIKVLKPGGHIFFTTPNKSKLSEFAVIFMAENIFKIAPKGLHDIEKFITPNDLTLLLERSK